MFTRPSKLIYSKLQNVDIKTSQNIKFIKRNLHYVRGFYLTTITSYFFIVAWHFDSIQFKINNDIFLLFISNKRSIIGVLY